jgi:hypothetical protein
MANLIRLKQIEGSTQLEAAVSAGNAISASGGSFQQAISTAVSASIQTSLSSSITDIVSASLSGALSLIATDVEVLAVSASIAATNLTISSSISSSNYNLSSSVSTSLSLISSSIASVTGDFSSSVARTFATQSSNLTSVSSSLSAFTSSIGLTIKNKLNTENVITSSHQLDGSVINNLTLGTTGDAYSLIVSGALAVVDADITISGSQYNVGGQIWVNGQTGSAGNPPTEPYDNVGNVQADIIDQGEW